MGMAPVISGTIGKSHHTLKIRQEIATNLAKKLCDVSSKKA
jgi:hypothetical protein